MCEKRSSGTKHLSLHLNSLKNETSLIVKNKNSSKGLSNEYFPKRLSTAILDNQKRKIFRELKSTNPIYSPLQKVYSTILKQGTICFSHNWFSLHPVSHGIPSSKKCFQSETFSVKPILYSFNRKSEGQFFILIKPFKSHKRKIRTKKIKQFFSGYF